VIARIAGARPTAQKASTETTCLSGVKERCGGSDGLPVRRGFFPARARAGRRLFRGEVYHKQPAKEIGLHKCLVDIVFNFKNKRNDSKFIFAIELGAFTEPLSLILG
jgi:hypothetical protein